MADNWRHRFAYAAQVRKSARSTNLPSTLSTRRARARPFHPGAGTYSAHNNADNPIGTMQSIEHTLRALDRAAADEQQHLQRLEKTFTDYQA